jgi:hypothetical protein
MARMPTAVMKSAAIAQPTFIGIVWSILLRISISILLLPHIRTLVLPAATFWVTVYKTKSLVEIYLITLYLTLCINIKVF